ncbi:hypothetical protein LOTGIDRAFT_191501 [Lottia gigantea]|uniref:EF-hand domain-containing protein n=1 Tax=Lottia gigantea TaxID=225164 RepID=V4A7K7_LOTGI|nr:hypothetical protein LOTGIDRAFT_191501 [Lottia gigantea]ESO91005.1 hypothetical protein LOTGIDRAFT_191501 [Lottia gigantea]
MSSSNLAVATLPPLSAGKVAKISPRIGQRFEGMTGPSYKINKLHHPLPPPKSLKPYVDTFSGELDTWPAHAGSHGFSSTSAMLSKNKSLVLVSEDEMGKLQMIPKPRFLEQLENFLKKELKALGVTDVTPSELRLQAHREVFEYLIEDFKTYKPLLSIVKNEYEMMLAHQRQQLRDMEPLKQMLVTVSEQCDQKIMALREEEKKEMTDLKAQNRGLFGQIAAMKNEHEDLLEQIARLKDKLSEEYRKYRDECDARKLLISDINDLRYQQEDYLMSKQNMQEIEEAQEDPVTLKIALRKAREDERAATQRLNEMVANYGDVIPRRDFEALEVKFKKMEEDIQVKDNDFYQLKAEHDALLKVQEHVTQQRDEFYLELETLKRSATPRPEWDRCCEYINGGINKWNELSDGKRSSEMLEILLSEMGQGGIVDSTGADYFDGQGTGAEVPVYLQHEGPVRNRRISKRDCNLLIRDIWREKSANDAEKTDGIRDNMGEFFKKYLESKFPLHQMVIEWAYNLHDACQRFSKDDNISLFYKILSGDVDEEVYHRNLQVIHHLLNHLSEQDSQGSGVLTKEEFKTGLKEFMLGIEEEDISSLLKAAETELENKDSPTIEYKNLFTEDDEGKTGPFLEEVKKWYEKEKVSFINEIKENVGDGSLVDVDTTKRAILQADMEINTELLDKILAWVFQTKVENVYDASPLEPAKIVSRLQTANIYRTGSQ